jgi:uncharacterized membrane protein SpoIIM required for sporulation
MNLDAFLRERRPVWDELEEVLAGGKRRPERLGPDGVRRLGELYRAAAADLALARRDHRADPSVRALEDLVLRARSAVYDSEPRRESVRAFVSHGYWRRVRERPVLLALAWTGLIVPGVLAAVWARHDPAAAVGLLPKAFRGAADPHGGTAALSAGDQAALSSQIFTNNIRVVFLSFAAGIAAGLGTGLLLVYNGAILGVVGGLSFGMGGGSRFVELVTPHGVLELSCIAVGASAGLRIGWAVVSPGPRARGVALRREARRAVEIVIGTVPWLVVAGLIEGFVTPRRIGVAAALALGFGVAAVYWGLVAWRGRSLRDAPATSLGGTPARSRPRAPLAGTRSPARPPV